VRSEKDESSVPGVPTVSFIIRIASTNLAPLDQMISEMFHMIFWYFFTYGYGVQIALFNDLKIGFTVDVTGMLTPPWHPIPHLIRLTKSLICILRWSYHYRYFTLFFS
jgi:hypothetical protein